MIELHIPKTGLLTITGFWHYFLFGCIGEQLGFGYDQVYPWAYNICLRVYHFQEYSDNKTSRVHTLFSFILHKLLTQE